MALREVRRRYISQWRLFAPASLALFAALAMTLMQIGAQQSPWPLGAAFVAGLVIGDTRGVTIAIQHDMCRPQVSVSYAAKLMLLRVAIAVGAATAVEIVGAFASPALEAARYWATLRGNACAGRRAGARRGVDAQTASPCVELPYRRSALWLSEP